MSFVVLDPMLKSTQIIVLNLDILEGHSTTDFTNLLVRKIELKDPAAQLG